MPLVWARLALQVLRAADDRDPRWDHPVANMRAYVALGATAGNLNME